MKKNNKFNDAEFASESAGVANDSLSSARNANAAARANKQNSDTEFASESAGVVSDNLSSARAANAEARANRSASRSDANDL